jgi:hypothetical protein
MIHILFLPGTFGSTINYVLQNFSAGKNNSSLHTTDVISPDGSMHNIYKSGHWNSIEKLNKFFNKEIDQDIEISTPNYPMEDAHAADIIDLLYKNCPRDKVIFMHVDDIDYAEINMLAQYYKMAYGSNIEQTIDMFCCDNEHDIINWNSTYTHWSEMQTWELREWFSIFYVQWVQEWINANTYVPSEWLQVSTREILNNTNKTFVKICEYYNGIDISNLDKLADFSLLWREKQQYILDEHDLINSIVKLTIANNDFSWKPLTLIAEAMVQQKLRSFGYELRCYNLNTFPINSKVLYNLIEKV